MNLSKKSSPCNLKRWTKMNKTNKFTKSISIRCDEKMEQMLVELQETMLLNTTSIMRLALARLYKSQIENGDNDDS